MSPPSLLLPSLVSRCSRPHRGTARHWGPAMTRPRTEIQMEILFLTVVTYPAVFRSRARMSVNCCESIPASLACCSLWKGESSGPFPLLLRFTRGVLQEERLKLHRHNSGISCISWVQILNLSGELWCSLSRSDGSWTT